MNWRYSILTCGLLALLCVLAACEPQPIEIMDADVLIVDTVPDNGALADLDFRQVVADAKAKVFPATVFILVLQENRESGREITQKISGSGVVISPTGEVVTNWHVIDKAVEVRCLLSDGTAMDATVIGSDKDTDLALVQL